MTDNDDMRAADDAWGARPAPATQRERDEYESLLEQAADERSKGSGVISSAVYTFN